MGDNGNSEHGPYGFTNSEDETLVMEMRNTIASILVVVEAAENLTNESFVDDFGNWGVTDDSYKALSRALSLLPNAKIQTASEAGSAASPC